MEADDVACLARGMQGLCIRIARRINRLVRRRGSLFADRYHSHLLKTPREVGNAVRYVVGNYRHHAREHLPPHWEDPLSSARFLRRAPGDSDCAVAPETWLLSVGWRRKQGDKMAVP